MSKKASESKKKASVKSRFALQLTRKQLFFWVGFVFLVIVWMFTLGVMVGRGFSPVRFDVQKLKKELIAFKQEVLKKEQARIKIETDKLSKDPDLDFYRVLTDKKEEARLKFAKGDQQTAKPDKRSQKVSKGEKEGRQGLLTIQVASLKNAKKAKRIVTRLKRKGYKAYEVLVDIPEKGTFHRVRVGHFADSRAAGRVAARLKQENFEAMIIRE